jgi:hypothetical protein
MKRSQRFFSATRILSCIGIMFFIFLSTVASADTVKLKTGREVSGKLKEINERDVVLQMSFGESTGTMGFRKIDVESINGLSIEEAQARLSTEKAFQQKDADKILASSVQEGMNCVSRTRKLDFKETPAVEIASTNKIKELLQKEIEKSYNQEKLEKKRKLLVRLGIISPEVTFAQQTLEFLSESVAGMYSPEDKKIYISEKVLKEIRPGLPSMTIMHEQVHALQDQYYDLKKIEDARIAGPEDVSLAMESVVEGDATLLMYDASLRSFKGLLGVLDSEKGELDIRSFVVDSLLAFSKNMKTKDGQPAIFFEELLFPYVWGGKFIQHLVNTKGWESLDALYKDLPVSSEQIMHPEKYYIARDMPKVVTLPDVTAKLTAPWAKVNSDAFGEFGFYLIGKKFLDELSTKVMSEGWGGDQYALYEDQQSKQLLLLSLSVWDSEKDAEEFYSFYKKIIIKKYPGIAVVKEEPNETQWKEGEELIGIFKSKDTVGLIEGAPEGVFTPLREAFVL